MREVRKGQFTLFEKNSGIWIIPKKEDMLVDGCIYSSFQMLDFIDESVIKQVVNVSKLPGIQRYSLAMPDVHLGYGFPIGGVAAFNFDEGIISPGGVGYDINCGVRVLVTDIDIDVIKPFIRDLAYMLYNKVPLGVGSKNKFLKVNKKEFKILLRDGLNWAIRQGFCTENEKRYVEDDGCLEADPTCVSEKAIDRGRIQLGTLGAGNHFLELSNIETICCDKSSKSFGLYKNKLAIILHTGSRGLGHQVCTDYVRLMLKNNIKLPDKQLVYSKLTSTLAGRYINAMNSAANFAWVNRQVIDYAVRSVLEKFLKSKSIKYKVRLLYDIGHNMAKIETQKGVKLCVHRKAAVRSLDKQYINIYKDIGQPIIIPGSMGTASYICVAGNKIYETFYSTAHGAGRRLSRRSAIRQGNRTQVLEELKNKNIILLAKGIKTIVEEMPSAYKDVHEVIKIMEKLEITKTVAKLVPLSVIKG